MITIKFLKKNERIIYFEITGHANHGEYGEDIVCSTVSSVSQMTLNGLLEILKLDGRLQYEEMEGYIVCDLDKSDLTDNEIEKSEILIQSMYSYLLMHILIQGHLPVHSLRLPKLRPLPCRN